MRIHPHSKMGCGKGDAESCERCEEVCPCIAGYGQLWSLFLLFIIGGLATLIASLYAFISLRTSIFRFTFQQPLAAYLNASALGIGIGVAMLVLALLTWCTCRSDGASAIYKAFFAFMLLLCAIGNIVVAVGAIQVVAGFGKPTGPVHREFARAWTSAAKGTTNTTTICVIQEQFECQGFESGDCTGTRSGIEERCDKKCTPPTRGAQYGCRESIVGFYRRWNFPLAILSLLAALFCVAAFAITIGKVSFNIAKQKGNM